MTSSALTDVPMLLRSAHRASSRDTTGSRFRRERSIWTTVPSRPIKTLAGISETP